MTRPGPVERGARSTLLAFLYVYVALKVLARRQIVGPKVFHFISFPFWISPIPGHRLSLFPLSAALFLAHYPGDFN